MRLKVIGAVLVLASVTAVAFYGFTRWRAEAQERAESEKKEAEIFKENDRQNSICRKTIDVMEQYRDEPGLPKAHQVEAALDQASQSGLSPDRDKALLDYWADLRACFLGKKDICKKSGEDYSRLLDVCM